MGEHADITVGQGWRDQRSTYDELRSQCPVAHQEGRWVILRHAEVVAAATDPATFSSKVTTRRAIPNSLDGTEHLAYRSVVDRYLTDERVANEEAQCRRHAIAIIDALPRAATVKTITSIGVPYAVRAQSTWLGWPRRLEDELVGWIEDDRAATRSGDRARTKESADTFDQMIRSMLDERRSAPPVRTSTSGTSTGDIMGELMTDTVDGRPLTYEEIVSILRNWTAGDLGSLATSVGVIVHHLASNPTVQNEVRELVDADDRNAVEAAVEEMLRMDDPFVSNRRVTTRQVDVGGVTIADGEQVFLNWTAANRDPLVFGDPDEYNPGRNAAANLVFGIGPHICPGRSLTLMELRVLVEELLGRTSRIDPAPDRPAVRQAAPTGGWARVPVTLR